MTIQLTEFRPDQPEWNGAFSANIMNVIPTASGYRPHPKHAALESLPALPAQQRGGFVARYSADGSYHFFAGTQTKLYKANFGTGNWDDVSQAGSDQVTNGGYGADTDWTKGTNVTITGGVGRFTAVADGDGFSQSQSFTDAIVYKVTYTVSGYSAGGVQAVFSSGTDVEGATRAADGTYTEYLTAVTGNDTFELRAVGTTTLDVDNVSVIPLGVFATVPSNDLWDFAQFGDKVLATHQGVTLQVFDLASDTEFDDAADAPTNARRITVVGDFAVAYGLAADEQTIQWSDINDCEDWTAGGGSLSDSQTFPDGGAVKGVSTEEAGLVLQDITFRRMIFLPGDASVFRFEKTGIRRGLRHSFAWAQHGPNVFYYSDDGFYRVSPSDSAAIGAERVNRWFADQIDSTRAGQIQIVADPVYPRIYVSGPSPSAEDFLFDVNLMFQWFLDKWAPINCTVSGRMVSAVAPGVTLEALDSLFSTLEDVEPGLDSPQWQGGAPFLAAFCGQGLKLGSYSGENLAVTIDTAEFSAAAGKVALLHDFTAGTDSENVTFDIGVRWAPKDDVTWFTGYTRNDSGKVCPDVSGPLIRVRLNFPEDDEWTHATVLEETIEEGGDR